VEFLPQLGRNLTMVLYSAAGIPKGIAIAIAILISGD